MRKIFVLLLAIGVSMTALLAGVGSSAHAAVTPKAATGWFTVYLHAEAGNGCASEKLVATPNGNSFMEGPGVPVVSRACSSSTEWLARDLEGNSIPRQGDELEFVTTNKAYALSFSPTGGYEEMTPNSDKTFIELNEFNPGAHSWILFLNQPRTAGMAPNSANVQLKAPPVSQIDFDTDQWAICTPSLPTCVPGGSSQL